MVQVILRLIDHKRVLPNSQLPAAQKESQRSKTDDTDTSSLIGHMNKNNQLFVRQSEVNKINNHFNIYYLNRLQFYKRKID